MNNKIDPRWNELAKAKLVPQTDPYQEACRAALQRILQHPYLPGAMRWAKAHAPRLYRQVMVDGPEAIQELWTDHAPMDQFQQILDSWVNAHRELCRLHA